MQTPLSLYSFSALYDTGSVDARVAQVQRTTTTKDAGRENQRTQLIETGPRGGADLFRTHAPLINFGTTRP